MEDNIYLLKNLNLEFKNTFGIFKVIEKYSKAKLSAFAHRNVLVHVEDILDINYFSKDTLDLMDLPKRIQELIPDKAYIEFFEITELATLILNQIFHKQVIIERKATDALILIPDTLLYQKLLMDLANETNLSITVYATSPKYRFYYSNFNKIKHIVHFVHKSVGKIIPKEWYDAKLYVKNLNTKNSVFLNQPLILGKKFFILLLRLRWKKLLFPLFLKLPQKKIMNLLSYSVRRWNGIFNTNFSFVDLIRLKIHPLNLVGPTIRSVFNSYIGNQKHHNKNLLLPLNFPDVNSNLGYITEHSLLEIVYYNLTYREHFNGDSKIEDILANSLVAFSLNTLVTYNYPYNLELFREKLEKFTIDEFNKRKLEIRANVPQSFKEKYDFILKYWRIVNNKLVGGELL